MKRLAAVAVLAGLVLAGTARADWKEEKRLHVEYQAIHSDIGEISAVESRAEAWLELAKHPHCIRLEYVGAWCVQNAADCYREAGDVAKATEHANAVIANAKAKRDCKAKAYGILAALAASLGDAAHGRKDFAGQAKAYEEAEGLYAKSLELDPQYEMAQKGHANVRRVLDELKGAGS